jgi:hypothetical protein
VLEFNIRALFSRWHAGSSVREIDGLIIYPRTYRWRASSSVQGKLSGELFILTFIDGAQVHSYMWKNCRICHGSNGWGTISSGREIWRDNYSDI